MPPAARVEENLQRAATRDLGASRTGASVGLLGLLLFGIRRRLGVHAVAALGTAGALGGGALLFGATGPSAALLGASLLMIADDVARVVVIPAELPVGIVTALVGAPFFLLLVRRQSSESLR